MKITCDIIRDLIPLYIEGIASADSAALVKDHVDSCEKCKIELENMSTPEKLPIDSNTLPLKKVRTTLKKKKLYTIIITIMLGLAVAAIVMGYLTTPSYFYSDDVAAVEEADGTITVKFDLAVSGYDMHYYDSKAENSNGGLVYHINAWDSIWNRYIAKVKINNIVLNPDGDKVSSVYYYHPDNSEDVLIYGKSEVPNGGVLTLPRLFLGRYNKLATLIAAICGIVLFIFRKKEKIRNAVMYVFVFPIAYLIAHICLKGFTSASYTATHDFFAILLVTLPLYIALLFISKLLVNIFKKV